MRSMNRKSVVILFGTLAVATISSTPGSAQDAPVSDCDSLLQEAWQAVADNYYDETRLGERWARLEPTGSAHCPDGAHEAIRLLLTHLGDRAVRLVPAAGTEAFLADMAGTTQVGIGLRELLSLDVDERTGLLTIVTPIPDSPAARAGLQTGDVVEAIDGVRSDTMDLALAMARLRGPAGTSVELRLRRDGRVRTVRVTREQLSPGPDAVHRPIETSDGGRIAYVRPPDFSAGTAEALAARLARADSQGSRGLILDLRDNPGGFVNELTGAADLFLRPGTVVARIRSRTGQDTLLATGAGPVWSKPMVVLINGGTASAAEALAGAIQAAGRGVLLGTRSFGKGLVHFGTPLSDGSLVLVPSGRLQTPHGRDVLDHAIEPDIPRPASPIGELVPDPASDNLVTEALSLLREPESLRVRMLLELHEADPDAGVVLYTLAREMDRQGRTAQALLWLRRLEATPWDGLLEDADFPASSGLPGYDSVAVRMAARARVVSSAETVFELHVPGLAPEGTAWDPRREEVLISSGHLRKVVAVDRRGRVRDVTTSAQDGLMAVLGMHVDDRDRLWVATTAAPFMKGYTPDYAGRAAIHAMDLATGQTVGRWQADRAPALLNDVRVATDGAVYTTDTANGRVLRLDPESGAWSAIGEDGEFAGPNGLALNARGDALFVADFHGLARIDLASDNAERLAAPTGARELGGIDGLSYHDGALIAIQNLAGKGRIWRLSLDPAEQTLVAAELLESGNPEFHNPTTGAVGDGGFYFLADPGLQRATDPEGPDPAADRLRLLRIPLEENTA